MKAVAVIPARLASTRMPRKMLREIGGKPLIGRVYEAVRSSSQLDDVIIATDSEEIREVCRHHGWKALLTSSSHRSGTERVREIAQSVEADIYLNVQGDEPLTRSEHIASLIEVMRSPEVRVGTLMTAAAPVDIDNPNAVKVVTDSSGRALYFSRAAIPYDRDGARPTISSISVFTPIASRHWNALSRCRSPRSNAANAWNSCVFWKMESRFTLLRRRMTQSELTRKKTCGGRKKFSSRLLNPPLYSKTGTIHRSGPPETQFPSRNRALRFQTFRQQIHKLPTHCRSRSRKEAYSLTSIIRIRGSLSSSASSSFPSDRFNPPR